MKKKIFSFVAGKHWWQGSLTINYNLRTLGLLLFLIVASPFILLYVLGIYAVQGVVWLWEHALKPFGLMFWGWLVLFWNWLASLFKRPAPDDPVATRKYDNAWHWVGAAAVFILLIVAFWHSCSNSMKSTFADVPEVVYEGAFDDVVAVRAYLDGVQESIDEDCPRALVGFKFINGKPVSEYDFSGLTYDESVEVVSQDWRPLVVDHLNPEVMLTHKQMVVTTLAAMRMGGSRFANSTFLAKLNDGNLAEAGKWLKIEDRETGAEPKQYFYVLQLLWYNELSVDELLNFPMFSYKGVNVEDMYDAKGDYVFNKAIRSRLSRGGYPTAAEALGL